MLIVRKKLKQSYSTGIVIVLPYSSNFPSSLAFANISCHLPPRGMCSSHFLFNPIYIWCGLNKPPLEGLLSSICSSHLRGVVESWPLGNKRGGLTSIGCYILYSYPFALFYIILLLLSLFHSVLLTTTCRITWTTHPPTKYNS